MTTQNFLVLIVYAPALMGDDSRPLAVVHAVEQTLPGVRLEWKVSKDGHPIVLSQRNAWLAEAASRGEVPLVCSGDECYPVTRDAARSRQPRTP